jgi:hypothetical protein
LRAAANDYLRELERFAENGFTCVKSNALVSGLAAASRAPSGWRL